MNSTDYDFSQESPALLGIGEVLVRLREEFKEISISKIRFLETNGLVAAERTASGYRKFSMVDVERLRYVLRMQRDHFLPLRVIKEHIDALNRGLKPQVGDVTPKAPRSLVSTEAIEISKQMLTVRMNRLELMADTGADAEFIDQMVEFGLIKPDNYNYFSVTASAVIKLAVTLRGYGLEPRHLKTVMSSASREVDLFAPIVKGTASGKAANAGAAAHELTLLLAHSITALHALLIREIIERQK